MYLRFTAILLLFVIASCKNELSRELDVFASVNDRLYCGSAPESEAHFMYLNQIGIKSIISVDGARPQLEQATALGMKYVHIPYSYDKVGKEQQLKLVKAFNELPKPVFIHCHHGKHRAPVGAAIVLRNTSSVKPDELLKMIEGLGTSKSYQGLYKTVRESETLPESDWSKSELKAYEKSSDLVEEMARIDRLWDAVKLEGELEERIHAALLLEESFFELSRAEKNPDLKEQYEEISMSFKFMRGSVMKKGEQVMESRLKRISGLCKACHSKERD